MGGEHKKPFDEFLSSFDHHRTIFQEYDNIQQGKR